MSRRRNVTFDPYTLVKRISDQTEERIKNTQSANELRVARNLYNMQKKQAINADPKEREKYIKTLQEKRKPLVDKLTTAISKGLKDDTMLRRQKIENDYRYFGWWSFGGKKSRSRTQKRKKI